MNKQELSDKLPATNEGAIEVYKVEPRELDALLLRKNTNEAKYDIIVPMFNLLGDQLKLLSDYYKVMGSIVGEVEFSRQNITKWYENPTVFNGHLQDTKEVIPIYRCERK